VLFDQEVVHDAEGKDSGFFTPCRREVLDSFAIAALALFLSKRLKNLSY